MFNTLSKKGQITPGLIAGIVFGVASLVIGVIIAFVIVSTLNGADLLATGEATTTVTNETLTLNATYTQIASYATNRHAYTITTIRNYSNSTAPNIPVANATIYPDGTFRRTGSEDVGYVNVTYTYKTYTTEGLSAAILSANLTQGVNNVSSKIPTVLLVAAIVLILGIMVFLVAAWQKMKIGGGAGI